MKEKGVYYTMSKSLKRRDQYNQEHLSRVLHYFAVDSLFERNKIYQGDLGAIYSKEETVFKLWAPIASQVQILIYDGHYGPIKEARIMKDSMDQRLFTYTMKGDHHGLTYRYRLTFIDGTINETMDPYAKAVTVNGQRSVVVDLERTNPSNWKERLPSLEDRSQTVIYEVHVRDFTKAENSGVSNKGKFLGAIERNTRNSSGASTGIDYLKKLGVTHVEFLPLFDYQSIDETDENLSQYNWGYDPLNYNAPEGTYSSNAYDPFLRIKEMKKMIQGFHDAGIRVIMDVVYNHVYSVEDHSFNNTFPGYFFRYDEHGHFTNGTGVGNDTASERFMMRKYIVDSVKYWAEEYHIDGFRFDLMGIHDTDTMNEVRRVLDEIDSGILLFGEGWELYTPLSHERTASARNARLMPNIGHFNDGLREAIKGNDFNAKDRGFINGAWYKEQQLAQNIFAGVDYGNYQDPLQVIQFAEAHDNYTLYDRLRAADPHLDEDIIVRRHMLASSIILLSQGIPFIHAGQEFLRSKSGVRDSYNQPDHINQLDWDRQDLYPESVALVRDLIRYRKSEPLLRMMSYEEILQRAEVVRQDYQILELKINGDEYDLYITFNGQSNQLTVLLPEDFYIKKLHNSQVYLDDKEITNRITQIKMDKYSAMVLKRFHKFEID